MVTPSRDADWPRAPARVRPRGFALIEAVVASLLLGLALVALIGLTGDAMTSLERGGRMETAARLADERLQLLLATGPEAYASVFPLSGVCDGPFEDFAYDLVLAPQGGGQPYRASVTISWPAGARRQSLTIETLIAPRAGDEPDPERKPKETVPRNEV